MRPRTHLGAYNTVCRRSLCTVELSRLQEALSPEDWFIPAPSRNLRRSKEAFKTDSAIGSVHIDPR